MDLTESIAPKSDQLNAEDLLTGPRTFTVDKVSKGSAEQPVDIHLVEFPGRPFRPSKTVRRILVNAWGPDANTYTGRRMTLYRDPAVKFGGMDVGGIRVSHLSHIEKPLSVALTVSRGKRQAYKVLPLVDAPPPRTRGPQTDDGAARATALTDGAEVTDLPSAADAPAPSSDRLFNGGDRERAAKRMFAEFNKHPDLASRDDRLGFCGLTVGRPIASSEDLTTAELLAVADALAKRVTE
jgi:hypothetical protein